MQIFGCFAFSHFRRQAFLSKDDSRQFSERPFQGPFRVGIGSHRLPSPSGWAERTGFSGRMMSVTDETVANCGGGFMQRRGPASLAVAGTAVKVVATELLCVQVGGGSKT